MNDSVCWRKSVCECVCVCNRKSEWESTLLFKSLKRFQLLTYYILSSTEPGYLGCFQIRPEVFSQINITETSEVGNNDQCLEFCRNKEDITIIEFLFGGNLPALYVAQRGDTCYCLNNISESFQERVCNTRCIGDPEQFCGRKQPDSYIVFNGKHEIIWQDFYLVCLLQQNIRATIIGSAKIRKEGYLYG